MVKLTRVDGRNIVQKVVESREQRISDLDLISTRIKTGEVPEKKSLFKMLLGGLLLPVLLFPAIAAALGLGTMTVNSSLNEPFEARIPILNTNSSDLQTLVARLGSTEQFRSAGLDRPFLLSSLKFAVVETNAGGFLQVSSNESIKEPFLNFLIEVEWAKGRLVREYTALLDPPVYNTSKNISNTTKAATTAPTQPVTQPVKQAIAPVAAVTIKKQPAAVQQLGTKVVGTRPDATPVPVQKPTPAASTAPTAASKPLVETYKVRRGDTLWRVARNSRPDNSVNIQRMMVSLLNANPDAFIERNINRMKAGQVLRIPESDEISKISRREALATIREHNELWDQYRQGLAADVTPRAEGAESSAGTAIEDLPLAKIEGEDELRLVAPSQDKATEKEDAASGTGASVGTDKEINTLKNELALSDEQLESRKAETAELASRLTETEEIVKLLKQQVELKNEELLALQTQLRETDKAKAAAEEARLAAETEAEKAKADKAAADQKIASIEGQAALAAKAAEERLKQAEAAAVKAREDAAKQAAEAAKVKDEALKQAEKLSDKAKEEAVKQAEEAFAKANEAAAITAAKAQEEVVKQAEEAVTKAKEEAAAAAAKAQEVAAKQAEEAVAKAKEEAAAAAAKLEAETKDTELTPPETVYLDEGSTDQDTPASTETEPSSEVTTEEEPETPAVTETADETTDEVVTDVSTQKTGFVDSFPGGLKGLIAALIAGAFALFLFLKKIFGSSNDESEEAENIDLLDPSAFDDIADTNILEVANKEELEENVESLESTDSEQDLNETSEFDIANEASSDDDVEDESNEKESDAFDEELAEEPDQDEEDISADGLVNLEDTLEQIKPLLDQTAEDEFDEDDPLEEVNLSLAYEQFDKAEGLVKKAIENNPEENGYKLRLLEVHYASNNKDAYEIAAKSLFDVTGGEGHLWESAVAMWSEMSPEKALFEDADTSSDQGVIEPRTEIISDIEDISTSEIDDTEDTGMFDLTSGEATEEESGLIDIAPDSIEELGEMSADIDEDSITEIDILEVTAVGVDPQVSDSEDMLDLTNEFKAVDEDILSGSLTQDSGSEDAADVLEFSREQDEPLTLSGSSQDSTVNLDSTDSFSIDSDQDNLLTGDDDLEALAKSLEDTISGLDGTDEDFNEMTFEFDPESTLEVTTLGADLDLERENEADAMDTKINLAKAYIELGDSDGAKSLLLEVDTGGNEAQKKLASDLLQQLS